MSVINLVFAVFSKICCQRFSKMLMFLNYKICHCLFFRIKYESFPSNYITRMADTFVEDTANTVLKDCGFMVSTRD